MKVLAKDIMNTDVVSVKMGSTLKEAIRIFADRGVGILPVVDQEEKLVGMLLESDVLEYSGKTHVLPMLDSSGWISPYDNANERTDYRQGIDLLTITTVEKVMTKRAVSVKDNLPGNEVAKIMKKRIKHIPVVDATGKLCGIIGRGDLINYLASVDE